MILHGSRIDTQGLRKLVQQLAVYSAHLCWSNSYPFCALKPVKFGLGCKANKCSDAGTGDLSVLPTLESSPCYRLHNKTRIRLRRHREATRSFLQNQWVRCQVCEMNYFYAGRTNSMKHSETSEPFKMSVYMKWQRRRSKSIARWRVTLKSHRIRNFHLI